MNFTENFLYTNYDRRCGEMFLTHTGIVVFHCSLCENKYHRFHEYFNHLEEQHLSNEEQEAEILALGTTISILSSNVVKSEIDISECNIDEFIDDSKDEYIDNNMDDIAIREEIFPFVECAMSEKLSLNTSTESLFSRNKRNDARYDKVITIKNGKNSQKKRTKNKLVKQIGNKLNSKKRFAKWRKWFKVISFEQKNDSTGSVNEEKRYECLVCGTVIRASSNCINHLRRHFEERRHKCSECGNSYLLPKELRAHMQRHTGEKPFLCTDCGKSFYSYGELNYHIGMHNNTLKKKECPVCHVKILNKFYTRHMGKHSNIRRFKCSICNASFKESSHLKNHIKIHENKREFQCHICTAAYNQRSSLKYHVERTHGEKIATSITK